MNKTVVIIFITLMLFSFSAFSQSAAHESRDINTEIIVKLKHDDVLSDVLSIINTERAGSVWLVKKITKSMPVFLLQFDDQKWEKNALLSRLKGLNTVRIAQANYAVEKRTEPNDPEFSSQWDMQIIGAPEVWDMTTSGLTSSGDTIVVAILDSGFDLSHEDLQGNIWNNHEEIANDGIDNDNNGYIDDMWGWNFVQDNNEMRYDSHGLSVSGIIGAKGNNDIGVTGVNWNVKLLFLCISNADDVVAAYEYVTDLRRKYNESNGAAGAFVVATNASFGVSERSCDELPAWGEMYDIMGQQGILTGAGTTNENVDVEIVGDMPTTCASDFIITVLNSTRDDEKDFTSGYGAVSIDLAAPGQGTHTTLANNRYGSFGGNSAAAPHLTGAISLLYGLSCGILSDQALEQPEQTALFIREAILNSVDLIPAFDGITVTGGRLNIAKAVDYIIDNCGGSKGELDIFYIAPNPAASDLITIRYETPDFEPYDLRVYNALGQLVHRNTINPPAFSAKSHEIETYNWAEGTYFVVLQKGNEYVTEPVMIIRHR
jgi:subtilisin family serine protease